MSQVSSKLRRSEGRHWHWCPGCEMMHPLPDNWAFNGDVEKPTFAPSFKQTTGSGICHYFIVDGIIQYCGDSFHKLTGQHAPMPDLPNFARD